MSAIRKKDLRALSYAGFGRLLEILTANVWKFCREQNRTIDVVAPILRSGAFPGSHLASKLGVLDVLPLQYKHTYDDAQPIRRHFQAPALTRTFFSRPTVLIADTNTVTGEIAGCAARDVRSQWPESTIVFASVLLDVSVTSLPEVDHLICARRSNERRTLSAAAAKKIGIPNDVFIFPWEELEEQWREIAAAQNGS